MVMMVERYCDLFKFEFEIELFTQVKIKAKRPEIKVPLNVVSLVFYMCCTLRDSI